MEVARGHLCDRTRAEIPAKQDVESQRKKNDVVKNKPAKNIKNTDGKTARPVRSVDSDPTPPILPARAPRTQPRSSFHQRRRGRQVNIFQQRRIPLSLLLGLDLLGPIVVGFVGLRQGVAWVEDVETERGGDAHSAKRHVSKKAILVATISSGIR
jgi:hypothetical protein